MRSASFTIQISLRSAWMRRSESAICSFLGNAAFLLSARTPRATVAPKRATISSSEADVSSRVSCRMAVVVASSISNVSSVEAARTSAATDTR